MNFAFRNFGRLQPGPIRHAELPPELHRQLADVYRDAGHFIWGTLEEFERGFLHDLDPARDVAVWRQIADALRLYCERHGKGRPLGKEEGARLVGTLAMLAMSGRDEPVVEHFTIVDPHVARQLVACWETLSGSTVTPVTFEMRLKPR